jgi:hypothetical protein
MLGRIEDSVKRRRARNVNRNNTSNLFNKLNTINELERVLG